MRVANVGWRIRRGVLSGVVTLGIVVLPFLSSNPAAALEPWEASGWSQISTGDSHTCALSSDAKVYCWGYGDGGQLGTGAVTNSSFPVAVNTTGVLAGKTITAIDAGTDYSCALTSEGSVYCWGFNNIGQLGNGTTQDSLVPVAVDMTGVLAGKTVTAVSTGSSHACAIASDTKAYCWGAGIGGRLGNDNDTNSSVPVAVDMSELADKSIASISVSGNNACVITTDGRAYCWGPNNEGQLGTGQGSNSRMPVPVDMTGVLSGKTILSISVGINHVCAIASDSNAYCWGSDIYGQLGDNSMQSQAAPVAVDVSGVLAGKALTRVTSGIYQTCVSSSDGRAYCWGSNMSGQLGNNTAQDSLVPVAVDVSGVLAGKTVSTISTSNFGHTCAIASSQAYCWGNNDGGKLGNSSQLYSGRALVPVPVSPLIVSSISSIQFDEVDDRKVLQISGTEFPSYADALSRSLVTLNGVQLPFCADGTGATAQQLIDGYHVSPTLVSDVPACYFIYSGGQPAMNFTNAIVWLPDNFDITAPGSVSVSESSVYGFNTVTPDDPDEEDDNEVVPPVLVDTPIVSLPLYIDKLPLPVASPVLRSQASANDTAPKLNLLVDERAITGTPTISTLPVFRGKAVPHSTITVTVHSDPVTCTTKADAEGDWECVFTTALPAGNHTVDIAMTAPDNVTTHLGPYPVLVAVAGQTLPSSVQSAEGSVSGAKTPGWSLPWSLAVVAVSAIIITLIVAIARRKRQ